MLSIILYDTIKEESKIIEDSIHNCVALLTDETLKLSVSEEYNKYLEAMSSEEIEDMGCIDVTGKHGITAAEEFRKKHKGPVL